MPIGPGKYDHVVSQVRQDTHAEGVILIVVNGDLGSGFSCQLPLDLTLRIPTVLRQMAADIEASVLTMES